MWNVKQTSFDWGNRNSIPTEIQDVPKFKGFPTEADAVAKLICMRWNPSSSHYYYIGVPPINRLSSFSTKELTWRVLKSAVYRRQFPRPPRTVMYIHSFRHTGIQLKPSSTGELILLHVGRSLRAKLNIDNYKSEREHAAYVN